MEFKQVSRPYMERVAEEALKQLDSIAAKAKSELNNPRAMGFDNLASVNTITSANAIQALGRIDVANRESYQVLASEPAIARVVVANEDGEQKTYYICRTMPISGILNLASYRAPVGRLASLSIGSEFTLPDGIVVEVIERAQLRPKALAEGWDSLDTLVETEHLGPITIESLRALLTKLDGNLGTEDLLGQLLAEETDKANIIAGLRRSVITKMGLRDQPVLDQFQDEIFRLPLNKRLLILGPPGTGKTTTLIRRLGQKLDTAFLDESEKNLVEMAGSSHGAPHFNSWLMFTPTELLKQYLKEAFAREGVPASDERIKTWQDYRRVLARNVFGILKASTGGGTFILKDNLLSLNKDALENSIEWFDDFNDWQRNFFLQEMHEAAAQLSESMISEVQNLGERLQNILNKASDKGLTSIFVSLASELPKVNALVTSMKDVSDNKIRSALNLQLNSNRAFQDELVLFIDSLEQIEINEIDDQEDRDSDEEEETIATPTGRSAAFNAYMQAIRAQSRAIVSKRTLSKTSRNGKIIDWLANRGLSDLDYREVGTSLIVQTNARRFMNPVKRYLNIVPKLYRGFRRERLKDGRWYNNEGLETREINPLELDILLLVILRISGDLVRMPNIQRDMNNPAWSSLQTIIGHYRNQILVDEATDFSPIQLACMAALAHPRLRSFFACGDFNQRLTSWGARSTKDLKWVFADFDIKQVSVSYRQSKQLNDLARDMILAVGGSEHNDSLPINMDSSGVGPALLEHAEDLSEVVAWLTDRIIEIERFVGLLPSTAIFVNNESEVEPLADSLNTSLAEHNIQVIACREGQAVGQESNVRVFDIQHIKGLEFEAVFFIGIDQLAEEYPSLFDKYLYVGTTRAATYLGVTCKSILPSGIENLRAHFNSDWQIPL